jgi:hypothetical protein
LHFTASDECGDSLKVSTSKHKLHGRPPCPSVFSAGILHTTALHRRPRINPLDNRKIECAKRWQRAPTIKRQHRRIFVTNVSHLNAKRKSHSAQIFGESISSTLVYEQPGTLAIIYQTNCVLNVSLRIKQQCFDSFARREPQELLARHRVKPAQPIWPSNRDDAPVGETHNRVALSERALLYERGAKVRRCGSVSHRTVKSEKRITAHVSARYC